MTELNTNRFDAAIAEIEHSNAILANQISELSDAVSRADENLDYVYGNLGLKRPSKESEE